MIIDEATNLYREDIKKQTKLSETSKRIELKLLDYRTTKVEFLCEVKSLTGSCLKNMSDVRYNTIQLSNSYFARATKRNN